MLHRLAAVARTAPLAARVQTRALATTAPRAFKLKKSEWANDPTVAHDEFKKYSAQPTEDVILIDTREPDEVSSSPIPGTVNVPLSRVEEAFSPNYNPGDFQAAFSFPKPTNAQKMVFLDRSGKRSGAALEAVQKHGYPNVRNYAGGVKEYQEKEKKK